MKNQTKGGGGAERGIQSKEKTRMGGVNSNRKRIGREDYVRLRFKGEEVRFVREKIVGFHE